MADVPKLHRALCPVCIGFQGGECKHCNGSGYVLVSPYAEGRGEQGLDDGELELARLRAQVKRLAGVVCCPSCGTEIERRAS